MTRLENMDDTQFMNYIALSGNVITIDDLHVGDQVRVMVLTDKYFTRESTGDSLYVNIGMQNSSKKGEILTVKRVRKQSNSYIVLSNGCVYYPEMIKEIL